MQGPAKPLYGGSIPPLASNRFLSMANLFVYLIRYKKYFIWAIVIKVMILFTIVSFDHLSKERKSKISANIAIGIAYLNEERNDEALYFFEQAFNASGGIYRFIATSGIINVLSKSGNEEKILNILKMIQGEKGTLVFNQILSVVYFSILSKNQLTVAQDKDFMKLKDWVINGDNDILKEQIAAIFLNLKSMDDFKKTILTISGKKLEGVVEKDSLSERWVLLKEVH